MKVTIEIELTADAIKTLAEIYRRATAIPEDGTVSVDLAAVRHRVNVSRLVDNGLITVVRKIDGKPSIAGDAFPECIASLTNTGFKLGKRFAKKGGGP